MTPTPEPSAPTFAVRHVEADVHDGMTMTLHSTSRPSPEFIARMLSTAEVTVSVPTPPALTINVTSPSIDPSAVAQAIKEARRYRRDGDDGAAGVRVPA